MREKGNKICLFCDQEAIVAFKVMVNGRQLETALCANHALEVGLLSKDDYERLTLNGTHRDSISKAELDRSCQSCGYQWRQYVESGILGCPDCYTAFANELDAINGATRHEGKIPKAFLTKPLLNRRIQRWKSQMGEAVAKEAYEDAAYYRDRISDIRLVFDQSQNH